MIGQLQRWYDGGLHTPDLSLRPPYFISFHTEPEARRCPESIPFKMHAGISRKLSLDKLNYPTPEGRSSFILYIAGKSFRSGETE